MRLVQKLGELGQTAGHPLENEILTVDRRDYHPVQDEDVEMATHEMPIVKKQPPQI